MGKTGCGMTNRPFSKYSLPEGPVLVLAPHPDDETIGCGGALCLHHKQGDRIKAVFITDGAGRRAPRRGKAGYIRLRQREARRASRVLGVDELEFWGYPDGRLRAARDLDERLAALLERERPAVVYRPLSNDPHPDHRRLAEGLKRALARRASRPNVTDIGYEIWALAKKPALIDVTAVWPLKLKAIKQYKTQLLRYDYLQMASRLGSGRGMLLGMDRYAEGYSARP
jgi:N-acetylglucosamine malate deacetylase 1